MKPRVRKKNSFKITIEIGQTSFGADFRKWRKLKTERFVNNRISNLGPFFLINEGLAWDEAAFNRMYKALNEGPVGRIARLYRG